MDFIRPIGPDRDVDPVVRVERARDERERRERDAEERQEQPKPRPQPPEPVAETAPEGPVEGDDGHLHIDIKA
jgi:hypothetical protein